MYTNRNFSGVSSLLGSQNNIIMGNRTYGKQNKKFLDTANWSLRSHLFAVSTNTEPDELHSGRLCCRATGVFLLD